MTGNEARVLGTWAGRLGGRLTAPDPRARVTGLADDSRRCAQGDLFFARRGTRRDGAAFARDALARGAVGVVTEEALPDDVPQLRVPAVEAALLRAADLFFDRPQDALDLVGITGTKGKTTIAWLAAHTLRRAGRETALLGTVHHELGGGRRIDAANTTPGALELRRLLAAARDAGARAAVLEVSSHALDQGRVAGLEFRTAVFSNLGRDHLDYHRDAEAYFDAKAKLFEGLGDEAVAVLNRDDPRWETLAARTRARVRTVGFDPAADLRITGASPSLSHTAFELTDETGRRVRGTTPLVGRHNLQNLAAAVAAAGALDVDLEAAVSGAASLEGVPGRLERVGEGADVEAFVDYAHTDEALRRVLAFLREVGAETLVCVVGCGGDRDRGKRPRMARTACDLADRVVLTSDNPRGEDPAAILAEMQTGVPAAAASRVRVLPDRREAIRAAVVEADAGATVLVAGKGHEKVQIVGTTRLPFDDVQEVRDALALRAERGAMNGAAAPS